MYIYIYIYIYICIYIYMYMCIYLPLHIYIHIYKHMMNALITIHSGLVPLFESLCAQTCHFRFEFIGGLRSHLLLFFFERKNTLKTTSSQSKISSRLLAYTYTCSLCTHIRIHICRNLVHVDSSCPPNVSSRLLGLHSTTAYVQCMCVCACIHTYTHIYSHPRWK